LKYGLSADLVEAAKRREVASLEFQKNSVSGLAMAWSQAVAVEGRQSPEDDVEAIRKVTVAEVNRVAREYLDTNHAITAILSPHPSGKPVSEKDMEARSRSARAKHRRSSSRSGRRAPSSASTFLIPPFIPSSPFCPTASN
jgi:hypothetical protein